MFSKPDNVLLASLLATFNVLLNILWYCARLMLLGEFFIQVLENSNIDNKLLFNVYAPLWASHIQSLLTNLWTYTNVQNMYLFWTCFGLDSRSWRQLVITAECLQIRKPRTCWTLIEEGCSKGLAMSNYFFFKNAHCFFIIIQYFKIWILTSH